MHKSATKCNETIGKWCKNKHGASKIIDTLETYQLLLVNSVLTTMIAHAMSAGLLPPGVVEAIDKRIRAFFWAGEESCNGGQCKVAWEDVCTPKRLGGLGVLSIPAQNSALLAKFLSKLHSTSDAPWVCWFRWRYSWSPSRDLGESHYLDTPIWKAIVSGLASFRSVSKVQLGNGSSSAFWLDLWLGPAPLKDRFPALFSDSSHQYASIPLVLSSGVRTNLGPRLSHAADADLRALTEELRSIDIRALCPDHRVGRLTNKVLANKDFYSNSFRHLQVDVLAPSVYARRFRHRLTDSAACLSCDLEEDVDHLLLNCPLA
jgi:hypothetical protein